MSDKKISIPVNNTRVNNQGVVRLDKEALAIVSNYAIRSGCSSKKVASLIIKQAEEIGMIEIGGEQ